MAHTVIITGGTGLIGKALCKALLEKGYHVIILTRNPPAQSATGNISFATWNPDQQIIDKEVISSADYIIHLAGAGVADKRWTKKRKIEIIKSRIDSSKLLVDSLRTIPNKVKAVISASAIGWYGEDPTNPNEKPFTEDSPADNGFLGKTCKHWEESIEAVTESGKRLVKLRIGIVLSKDGGAMKEFLKPLKFGVAAILGNGKQIISWIHIDDLVDMFIAALENDQLRGAYNGVAPNPVSNKTLTLQLAKTRNKFFIPMYVPTFILKIMLGEMSVEILKSTTVSAEKILKSGFQFKHPSIEIAVENSL
jgi:uncharacterized protein (TIGR01777 family)